ncbi:tail sheath stabilizer and completion protein [bacterium]|nr:tail sheath stabilizer and completion protein [bacterium]
MADLRQLHFYDEQVRRYLLQFIRIFSGFNVKTGKKLNDGTSDYYIKVPSRYGDVSRMAATIMKGNSENIVNSAPFISSYIQSLQPDRQRLQEPFFSDTVKVNERQWDPISSSYTSEQGNRYSVGRLMPVPYLLNMQVDIWTSNTDQKLQLLEQILVLFNPALEIQQNDNPIDWTTITTVELTDIQWTSRSIPAGIEDQIDIASLFFQIPIWINPPALVTRQNVIRNIIHNIYEYNDIDTLDYDPNAFEFFADLQVQTSVVVTPGNNAVQVTNENGNVTVQLLENGNYKDDNNSWEKVISNYGLFHDGVSRMRLKYHGILENIDEDIIGILSSTNDPSILSLQIDVDTLPGNTINPIDKIIDPSTSRPGFGNLPFATVGQRYLCLNSDAALSQWGIDISINDIIEYNGSNWVISLDSSETSDIHYVTNITTSQQFKLIDNEWVDTFQGLYEGGYWRLELLSGNDDA